MAAPTRFLILSDTHGQWPYNEDSSTNVPTADVFLHCGDLTQVGGFQSFRRAIENIKTIKAELKLVIAGNHDLELDPIWWKENTEEEDEVEDSANAIAFLKAQREYGICYLEEGTHTFTLSTGTTFSVHASPYTPEFNGFAFAYQSDEDRFNPGMRSKDGAAYPHPVPDEVDIMITHGPPALRPAGYQLDINHKGEHYGCQNLARALERVKPKLHCFGHLHEVRGVGKVKWMSAGPLWMSFDGPWVEPRLEPEESGNKDSKGEKETVLVNAAMLDNKSEAKFIDVYL